VVAFGLPRSLQLGGFGELGWLGADYFGSVSGCDSLGEILVCCPIGWSAGPFEGVACCVPPPACFGAAE